MKATELFRLLLLSFLLLCGVAACSDEEDIRLSPLQETLLGGDASTLQIDLTRGDWRIASVTSLEGITMVDDNNRPLQLEGLGSLHFRWFDLTRESETRLTLATRDNFDGEERGLVLHLEMKTGFYKEQITIRQSPSTHYYQVESIAYSLSGDDTVKETTPQPWAMIYEDYTTQGPEVAKTTVWPFSGAPIYYSFQEEGEASPFNYVAPEEGIYVTLPKEIVDGNIVYEANPRKYGNFRAELDEELKKKEFEVDMVRGKRNEYTADVYYREMQLSYTLTLSRAGDERKQVFSGKFVRQYPYDCSPIRHTVSDLPEQEERGLGRHWSLSRQSPVSVMTKSSVCRGKVQCLSNPVKDLQLIKQ